MLQTLVTAISVAGTILTWIVLIDVVLSFFLSPFHSLRRTLDSLVDPMLAPIRRVVPPVGMFDLSPIVLIILIQVIRSLLVQMLYAIG